MLDELLAMKVIAKMGRDKVYPSNADVDAFRHIEGLKVGDKLRYKGGPQKSPDKDGVVTVYSILESEKQGGVEGSQIFRYDFTALFECEDDDRKYLLEYAQDSRYYECVSE